jgi:3-oxoacyl-[acyl-carrier protein] reductase
VISTQLRVPFMVARRVVEEFLVAQVSGRIVYVAYAGNEVAGCSPGYGAAQAGLRALVRCITKEFGRRELACNAVVVHEDRLTEISALEPAITLLERIHSMPEVSSELAETVLFLASREASFVNGEVLDIRKECLQRC